MNPGSTDVVTCLRLSAQLVSPGCRLPPLLDVQYTYGNCSDAGGFHVRAEHAAPQRVTTLRLRLTFAHTRFVTGHDCGCSQRGTAFDNKTRRQVCGRGPPLPAFAAYGGSTCLYRLNDAAPLHTAQIVCCAFCRIMIAKRRDVVTLPNALPRLYTRLLPVGFPAV